MAVITAGGHGALLAGPGPDLTPDHFPGAPGRHHPREDDSLVRGARVRWLVGPPAARPVRAWSAPTPAPLPAVRADADGPRGLWHQTRGRTGTLEDGARSRY
jgi:hypothetical protein